MMPLPFEPLPSLLQLTKSGPAFRGAPGYLAQAHAEFQQRHCLLLPQFLEPELLGMLQEHIRRGRFYDRAHEGISVELCLTTNIASAVLQFLVNHAGLFRCIEQITGCPTIRCFGGRVYRLIPGPAHYGSWHSDAVPSRLIGLSVNLSTEVFSGGEFELRCQGADEILCQVSNTGFGDALLFRIAPDLLHRVAGMHGTVPKTAYAGWFRSQPFPAGSGA